MSGSLSPDAALGLGPRRGASTRRTARSSGSTASGARPSSTRWRPGTRCRAGPRGGPGAQAATIAARRAKQVADILTPYRKDARPASTRSPARSPTRRTTSSRVRLQNLAGLLAQPLGIRVAAVEADGDFDTHDRQAEDLAERLEDVSEALVAVPGRPRGARHRRPRADARLVGVRPPRRSRTTRTGPTTAPAASPSSIGTRASSGVLSDYPTSAGSTATTTSP